MKSKGMKAGSSFDSSPIFWASLVRLFAMNAIFLFHFLGQRGYETFNLDVFGLHAFVFISGYFAFQNKISPLKWLKKRFLKILVPYWSVILVVIIINALIGYKSSSLFKDAMTFLGLSLFIENPVYVISWFITLILILYCFATVLMLVKNAIYRSVLMVTGFFAFLILVPSSDFFYIFFFGGFLFRQFFSGFRVLKIKPKERMHAFNRALFLVQSHCYSFFLIHGGILLFFNKILKTNDIIALLGSYVVSCFLTIYHKRLSDQIIAIVKE